MNTKQKWKSLSIPLVFALILTTLMIPPALFMILMPHLEVIPPLIEFGPSPAIGEEFDVNILIKNLAQEWQLVAIEFRLGYNNTLLEVVSITEGPFLKDPRWNWYGTFFTCLLEPNGTYGPHIYVGNLLYPNSTSGVYDQTEFPNGQGTVATIRFKVIYQGVYPQIDSCVLNLFNVKLYDKNITEIPSEEPVDGLYTIIGLGYHDIVITRIKPSKTIVGQGYNLTAHITIVNVGNFTETFTLFATCGFIRNVTLASGAQITIDNIIHTSNLPKGNYSLCALILPCFGDCNPTDNIRIEGNFTVAMPGDVNADGKVDMKDVYPLAKAFLREYPDPRYNANADINGDGKNDMKDVYVIAKNFLKEDP